MVVSSSCRLLAVVFLVVDVVYNGFVNNVVKHNIDCYIVYIQSNAYAMIVIHALLSAYQ